MSWKPAAAILVVLLLATACRASVATAEQETQATNATAPAVSSTPAFGRALSSVSAIIGTELKANAVVSLPCIPSRRDPVGVWLALQIVDAQLRDDTFTISVTETDARLGSHPSGCREPKILAAQSIFLLSADREPVFAGDHTLDADVITLEFSLAGRSPNDVDVVVLPTFEFLMGDGMRQTTVFGLMGRYSLVEPAG